MMTRRIFLACLVSFGLSAFAHADQGNPKLKTIEAIRFGPSGLLIIGGGSDIVTVDTGDTKETTWTKTEIANIDETLAGKLGLKAKDIEITRIAINPASKKLYAAVRSLKANQSVILTIDGDGKVGEFSLEDVKYTKYPLTVKESAITKVNDVIWAGGRIVAATQATDKFASRVFTIYPGKGSTSFFTETFHTGHNAIETKAPIRCLMTYDENSKANIVGSFTCTPLVRYPLDDTQPDVKVKGTTVVELGQGNTPRSMFGYEKDGKKFILVNAGRNNKQPAPKIGLPNAYWCAKVDHTLLKETVNVNENAPWRVGKGAASLADRVFVAKDYFGTTHMDQLDATRAIVIRDVDKTVSLNVLTLP
jgi:hypothetical protein